MRTTLTIEEDVAAVLVRLRQTRRTSLKRIVNEALRVGLSEMAAPDRKEADHHTRSVDLGRCFIGNLDDVSEVLSLVEGETYK